MAYFDLERRVHDITADFIVAQKPEDMLDRVSEMKALGSLTTSQSGLIVPVISAGYTIEGQYEQIGTSEESAIRRKALELLTIEGLRTSVAAQPLDVGLSRGVIESLLDAPQDVIPGDNHGNLMKGIIEAVNFRADELARIMDKLGMTEESARLRYDLKLAQDS